MPVALLSRKWTLAEVHRLPEDGNRYELVHGDLFVTPPPSDEHETIAARLHAALAPFVEAHSLDHVYRPRAVMRHRGSEAEPDLMVRRELAHRTGTDKDWSRAPVPILVVEIASPHTLRRDRGAKRELYMEAGVNEYWIVDPESREITVITPHDPDGLRSASLEWSPPGITGTLTIDVAALFG